MTSKLDSTVLSAKGQHRSRDQHKPIHATMRVNGDKTVRFQVDMEATCNVLREKDLPESVQILPVVRTLSFYNGTKVKSLGECELKLENITTGEVHKQSFVIVKDGVASLLGVKAADLNLVKILTENICVAAANIDKGMTKAEFVKNFRRCLMLRLVSWRDLICI